MAPLKLKIDIFFLFKKQYFREAIGVTAKISIQKQHPITRMPGTSPSSAPDSSVPLMQTLRSSRWWLSTGVPATYKADRLGSRLQASTGPVPTTVSIWELNQQWEISPNLCLLYHSVTLPLAPCNLKSLKNLTIM